MSRARRARSDLLHRLRFALHLPHDVRERVRVDAELDELHERRESLPIEPRVEQRRHLVDHCAGALGASARAR